MRRILIDRARRRRTTLHGGGMERVDIADAEIAAPAVDDELLAVHEALEKYEKINPAKAELVKLRYFAGMTHDEAAKQLGISVVTAKRHWETARAWLYLEIKLDRAGPPPGSMLQKP